ncbi:MAG: PspC domain-containing protein [Gammaproteobacteria bacterium]|nr:PspC domain-containing protein [Gammaproteobacteria bacterium]MDE0440661.1 PspC domain-containing protein [Gammaproteobacteria bacterium]
MNGPADDRRERGRAERGATPDERIQEAVARIERAARDLSASATDRAADYIEGVADRISPNARSRSERERTRAWPWSGQPRTPRLCRDRENGKLLGVCAGIANYYGLETWVVRLIALTGLVFLTSVTLVGYFVAALLMDPSPLRKKTPRARPPRRRRREPGRRKDDSPEAYSWIPRQRLRDVSAEFDQVELKLRRMETHVTSGHYELHRELAELEKHDTGSATSRSG